MKYYEVWVGANMAGGEHESLEKAQEVLAAINAMYPGEAEIMAYDTDTDEWTHLDEMGTEQ